MPLYPKRIQIGVEIWFADYFDKLVESLGTGEGELGRVILALGAGALESHLAGHSRPRGRIGGGPHLFVREPSLRTPGVAPLPPDPGCGRTLGVQGGAWQG